MSRAPVDAARLLAEIRSDINVFLTPDVIALAKQELKNTPKWGALPATLPAAWDELRAREEDCHRLRAALDQNATLVAEERRIQELTHNEEMIQVRAEVAELQALLAQERLLSSQQATLASAQTATHVGKFEEVQQQRNFMLRAEQASRDEHFAKEKEFRETEKQLRTKVLNLEHEVLRTQNEASGARLSLQNQITDLSSKVRQYEDKLQIKEIEMESLQRQALVVAEQASTLRQAADEKDDLAYQLQKAHVRINHLEASLNQNADANAMGQSLMEEAQRARDLDKHVRSFQVEIVDLRARVRNAEVLSEQIAALKNQLERAERNEALAVQAEAQCQLQLKEWSDWKSLLGSQTPVMVAHDLQNLRQQQVAALEERGRLTADIARLTSSRRTLEMQLATLTAQGSDHAAQRTRDQARIDELQLALASRSAEIDSLRGLVDAYSKDAAQAMELTHVGLQEEAEMLRHKINVLEDSLAKANAQGDASATIAQLEATCTKQATQIETLQVEVARLEAAAGKGAYNPENVKVLHFAGNPEREAHLARIRELETEITALRERVNSTDGSAEVSITQLASNAEYEKQLRDAEVRSKRLKEVCKKQIQAYRDAACELLGFRMDLLGTKFTLRSKYAENEKDELVFNRTDTGKFDMLETEYSATLDKEIQTFLVQLNSIPALMCHITTELFNRQTYA